jgi:hypothetical protein
MSCMEFESQNGLILKFMNGNRNSIQVATKCLQLYPLRKSLTFKYCKDSLSMKFLKKIGFTPFVVRKNEEKLGCISGHHYSVVKKKNGIVKYWIVDGETFNEFNPTATRCNAYVRLTNGYLGRIEKFSIDTEATDLNRYCATISVLGENCLFRARQMMIRITEVDRQGVGVVTPSAVTITPFISGRNDKGV